MNFYIDSTNGKIEFDPGDIAKAVQESMNLSRKKETNQWFSGNQLIDENTVKNALRAEFGKIANTNDIEIQKTSDYYTSHCYNSLLALCEGSHSIKLFTIVSGKEFNQMEHKPIQWLWDNLIPAVGFSMLTGEQKIGKSWICLQLALAVSEGKSLFGRKCKQGEVLYFDLEGTEDRTAARMHGNQMNDNLFMVYNRDSTVLSLRNGLIDQLEMWVEQHKNTKLIIIDHFALIADKRKHGQDSYEAGLENTKPLLDFARKNGLCVLTTHHTKKPSKEKSSVFQSYIGGGSIFGSAESQMILVREDEHSTERKFIARGRDYKNDVMLTLRLDEMKGLILEGNTEEIERDREIRKKKNNPIYQEVCKRLQIDDEWKIAPTNMIDLLAEKYGYSITAKQLSIEINKLRGLFADRGIIFKHGSGGTNTRAYTFKSSHKEIVL